MYCLSLRGNNLYAPSRWPCEEKCLYGSTGILIFFHRILFRDKNLWIEAEGLEGSNQGTEGIHSVTCRNIKKIYLHLLFPIAITQFNYQASVTLFIRHRTLIEHLLFPIFLIPPRYFPSDEDEESEEGEEE